MFGHRRHSEVPSLNTTSTADISFMLLVFFLVTSSMDSDKGLRRELPPPPQQEEQPVDIKPEDIMTVELCATDKFVVEGDTVSDAQLQKRIVDFAAVAPLRRVISLDVAPSATYDAYFHLQESVVAAYRRLKVVPRISETIKDENLQQEEGGDQ